MRAATHRCGEARARQSDFPPRNYHSIPRHPCHSPQPLRLCFSFYFLITTPFFCFGSSFLFRFPAFLPRTPFHSLRPFSLLSHLFLSCARTHTHIHILSLLSFSISPHLVQYSVRACTERFAARLSARIDTLVDHAYMPVAIYDRKFI